MLQHIDISSVALLSIPFNSQDVVGGIPEQIEVGGCLFTLDEIESDESKTIEEQPRFHGWAHYSKI